ESSARFGPSEIYAAPAQTPADSARRAVSAAARHHRALHVGHDLSRRQAARLLGRARMGRRAALDHRLRPRLELEPPADGFLRRARAIRRRVPGISGVPDLSDSLLRGALRDPAA